MLAGRADVLSDLREATPIEPPMSRRDAWVRPALRRAPGCLANGHTPGSNQVVAGSVRILEQLQPANQTGLAGCGNYAGIRKRLIQQICRMCNLDVVPCQLVGPALQETTHEACY